MSTQGTETAATAALDISRAVGQLIGRAEWIGRDFVNTLIDRLQRMNTAPDPNLEPQLRVMVELIDKAASGFESMVAAAQRLLGEPPVAN